ncbi:hypothetical protein SAMN05660659_04561 [Pseudomonas sp. LAMO17WK12:I6]|jgi:hypothetical protein|nr:hypothetical protein SAMN05660659_04561 [Pseudomonas sp. LAMO17WK12:I6]SNY44063.1 hypothetical protein SAMN05660455_05036 [Pseudomonas sp. LAMO17WK12:I5]
MTKMATTKMGTDLYFGNKSTPFFVRTLFCSLFYAHKKEP